MKCNYHTHTMRCHHAVGEDEAYVLAALEAGFDELGFADHAPWPYASHFVSNIRMSMEDFPGYLQSIRCLREKYRGQIEIHIGLESEFFPTYADHLRRLAESGDVDYLILGAHYTDSDEFTPYVGPLCQQDDGVKRYAENCIQAMETGLSVTLRILTYLCATVMRRSSMPFARTQPGIFVPVPRRRECPSSLTCWDCVPSCPVKGVAILHQPSGTMPSRTQATSL